MYDPIQNGIRADFKYDVLYHEQTPAQVVANTVSCYWEIRSVTRLQEDFHYLILPDGCIDLVFDIGPLPCSGEALAMALDIRADTINLGREFHYVGIRFQPGTWLKNPSRLIGNTDSLIELAGQNMPDLTNKLGKTSDFSTKLRLLEELAIACQAQEVIKVNHWLRILLTNPGRITSVADMVKLSGYSDRHLQRLLKEQTGYSPHDFLKIIRFQQSLKERSSDAYSDQSHYIHQFKRMTGFTPKVFQATY